MSEMAARSCNGKRPYKSELRADAAAKALQKRTGIPMKAYPCEVGHPGMFHLGTVEPQGEGFRRTGRAQRTQSFVNSSERLDKKKFQRKP